VIINPQADSSKAAHAQADPFLAAGVVAEANGITGFPQVRDTLGQIAAEVGLVDGLLHGMEAKGSQVAYRSGAYYVPDRHLLYAAQALTQQLYPKVITTIRDLAGGGLIMVPSSIADRRSRPCRHHRQDPEVAGLSPAGAGEILQARLGRARL
jgi:aromatic ring hydroxylase